MFNKFINFVVTFIAHLFINLNSKTNIIEVHYINKDVTI